MLHLPFDNRHGVTACTDLATRDPGGGFRSAATAATAASAVVDLPTDTPFTAVRSCSLPRWTAVVEKGGGARAVVLLLGVAAMLLVGAPAASAHNVLVFTDPADGAVLAAPPQQVRLVFNQPATALGSEVEVRGPDGSVVSEGDPQLVDAEVTQPLAAGLPAGSYTVLWRVTSADGHPISGELAFEAQSGDQAAATPLVPASPSAPVSPSVSVLASSPPTSDDATPGPGVTALLVGAAALAMVAVALAAVMKGRRGGPGPRPGTRTGNEGGENPSA